MLVDDRVGSGLAPYQETWDLQRRLHDEVAAGARDDTLLLVEHEPVFTAGRRTAAADRPVDGAPVIDVDRGGRITWHGPGQLVGYPIVRLAEPIDVVAYVRALEGALIEVCDDFALDAIRVGGRSGVWLPAVPGDPLRPERKLAAIGVRVARGVTMHGFALNVCCDLGAYDAIVPCGIADAGVTTMSAELGRTVALDEVVPLVVERTTQALAPLLRAGQREPAPSSPAMPVAQAATSSRSR
jgi:lipoyl(octanoyl) transferase